MTTDFDTGFILGCQVGEGYDTGIHAIGSGIKDSDLLILGIREIWRIKDTGSFYCVAIDDNYNVYLSDYYYGTASGQFKKISSDGSILWEIDSPLYTRGIAIGASGIYVVGYHRSTPYKSVVKFDTEGNELWSLGTVDRGMSIALDAYDNLYVAYNNSFVSYGQIPLQKISPTGTVIWSNTGADYALGVVIDSLGYIYVIYGINATNKRLRKLDSAGNEVWSNTLIKPNAIAIDDSDGIYIACEDTAKSVVKLDTDGNEIWSVGGVKATCIAVDADHNTYVSASGSYGDVYKLDSAGNEVWREATQYPMTTHALEVDNLGNLYIGYESIVLSTWLNVGLRKLYHGMTEYTVVS